MARTVINSKGNSTKGTPAPSYTLRGLLTYDNGTPADNLAVRLYNIGFAGKDQQLAQTQSDTQGDYIFTYAKPSLGLSLQVRAVDSAGKETVLSSVLYNVPDSMTLNLVVPSSLANLKPEFDRLSMDLQQSIGGVANLSQAQEGSARQDLSLLYETTNWDARLLALAATAAQQSKTTGLDQDVLYALYRTGLPTDPNKLALLPGSTIANALNKAVKSGIVGLNTSQVAAAQKNFLSFSSKAKLNLKAAGATSTFQDLLGKTFSDAAQQGAFLDAFFNPTTTGAQLWQAAAQAGIPDSTIKTLQAQGKLAFLTLNNATLINGVQSQLDQAGDVYPLADKDFHLDTTWKNLLNNLAGNDPTKLAALIPGNYGGTDPASAYSADLARKIRISYPTRVVARMVENGSLPLPSSSSTTAPAAGSATPAVTQGVTSFLRSADLAGYKLGKTPLNAFLKNPPQGVTVPTDPNTLQWIKNLHRLYQVTPSNESLQAAVKLGFSSARDIAAYTPDQFNDRFASAFPSTQEASLVYRKSQQVSAVAFNAYNIAKQLDNQPPVFAMSASTQAVQAARSAISAQFPSMSSMFGSLDFCECDDCRSVLSPAAYLVDVLHFLDPSSSQWASTTNQWQTDHGGEAYPFGTPYSVLTGRRPDLPYLNLSCENTNTALPYIDIVNEILEYYAANGNLGTSATQNAAYDTGSAASADLIAEPQNILPAAYAILANRTATKPAVYPFGLPFDLWIETVRGFLSYFKMPLSQVLDAFRPADNLELFTDANHYPYYRATIFAEQLAVSPAEYALFTDPNAVNPSNPTAAQGWYKLYGYSDPTTASEALGTSAAALASALGISYQDLSNLVLTGFVNPGLAAVEVPMAKFGLSLSDVFSYTGQPGYTAMTAAQKTSFEANLQSLVQKYYPQANSSALKTWLNQVLVDGYSNQVLVLKAPISDPGDFQDTLFQYAGGNQALGLDFLKMNLFVRLWKKLGWSMDQVDQALTAFLTPLIPSTGDSNFGTDFSNGMKSALVYLAHLQDLYGRLQPGPYGLTGVLPVWGGISTTGDNPLYAQLFLTAAVLNNDPVFDDPAGEYLCYYDTASKKYLPFRWSSSQTQEDLANGYVLLGNHATALQGALGLTGADLEAILADNGLDISSAPLTLANVSLLYRYAILSQGLQLSVADFINLKALSGLNPFQPLKTGPLAVLADDVAWTQTLQLASDAALIAGSGFTVKDLDYLLRLQVDDPAGKYAQSSQVPAAQIKVLSDSLHAIQAQDAVPSDPSTFTDDQIRQKIAQIFPSAIVQTFMGMWSGTIQYTASNPTSAPVTPAQSIPSNVLPQEPGIQLTYDPVQQKQTLVFQGVPVSTAMTRVNGEVAALVTSGTLNAGQQTLFQSLLNMVQAQAQAFFQSNLQTTTGTPSYGFLPPADFDLLFTPNPSNDSQRRSELAKRFLPYLQAQQTAQAVIQYQASQLSADPGLTQTLLTNVQVLLDPTQPSAPGTPLLAAFEAAADQGLTITYYSDGAEATVLGSPAQVPTADTSPNANPSKPSGVNSAHVEGWLVVPADGPYSFTATLPNSTAVASLRFDFLSQPLFVGTGTASGSVYTLDGFTQFQAGVPYHFNLDFLQLGGGDAQLQVQGEALALGPLSQLSLYPQASVMRYTRAAILLNSTFELIQGFNLDATEVVYLATHSTDFGNLSFSALPTQASDVTAPKTQALFGEFLRLADYGNLRQGPAGNTDGLAAIFDMARQTLPASSGNPVQQATTALYQSVANLTRRDLATVQSLVPILWGNGVVQSSTTGTGSQAQTHVTVLPLAGDLGFLRLWQALQMVQTLGVQPSVLGGLTAIAYPSRALSLASGTPDPGYAVAQALRNAVKSSYAPANWRPVAQAIFDPLRQKKRDALCAYLLTLPVIQTFGATDTNGLFEFFLVDPGMEPIVQATRIQLAQASVQTFIQRCLLNLEDSVKPSVIDSNQWEWMKRYRVWEANREIFLWPENWLIPEFRENATDLFQALQGALLQGNITSDSVEAAYTTYLQGLDERARLDIVSMFNQPAAPGDPPGDNILHVIGRNHGRPQKYYYRTFSNGIWNGWTPVAVAPQGNHIAAAIWRGRLNLFWLTFLVQGGSGMAATTSNNGSDDGTGSGSLLTSLTFSDLAFQAVGQAKPPAMVQVQLNWSEYYQGQWSTAKCSDMTRFAPQQVWDDFDPDSDVYIRVSVDTDSEGNETAIRVHLDGLNKSFRLTGKNAEPDYAYAYWLPGAISQSWPYPVTGYDASKWLGYDPGASAGDQGNPSLLVQFPKEMEEQNGNLATSDWTSESILQTVNAYELLTCDNLLSGFWSDDFTESFLFEKALTNQLAALSSPFFYMDASDPNATYERTFFVQPELTETTVFFWDGWVVQPAYGDWTVTSEDYFNVLPLQAQVPVAVLPPTPDPAATFNYAANPDWVSAETTQVSYNGTAIGKEGGVTAAAAGPPSVALTSAAQARLSVTSDGSGLGLAAAKSFSLRAQTLSGALQATAALSGEGAVQ